MNALLLNDDLLLFVLQGEALALELLEVRSVAGSLQFELVDGVAEVGERGDERLRVAEGGELCLHY